MNKIAILTLAALPLAACNTNTAVAMIANHSSIPRQLRRR